MSSILRSALVAASLASVAQSIGCIDENGQAVDWYAVFKFHGGLDYGYIDVDTPSSTEPVQLTGRSLNSTSTAVGGTVAQLYGNAAKSLAIIAYNDEKPAVAMDDQSGGAESAFTSFLRGAAGKEAGFGADSGTSGHTKGVLAADANGGFWLVHSVPKYPDLSLDEYSWTASTTYGQSFLCITLDAQGVEAAAGQIAYNDPLVYHSALPNGLGSTYPEIAAIINGNRAAGGSTKTISTVAGHQFTSFAKSGTWGQDLYEDLVQPYLQLNFLWETWRRSPAMATYCKPDYAYDSINVLTLNWLEAAANTTASSSDGKEVAASSASAATVTWKYTQDHSKYGIAVNSTSSEHYVCIGDINRMSSQWTRGGGTVCFRAAQVYNRLLASIATADECAQ